MEFNQLMSKLRGKLSFIKNSAPPPPAVALTAWLEQIFDLREELSELDPHIEEMVLEAIAGEEGVPPYEDICVLKRGDLETSKRAARGLSFSSKP